ncbi:MAG: aminopeptidase N C-terminal domain-containing protein, partial [Bacteroidales bacterium]
METPSLTCCPISSITGNSEPLSYAQTKGLFAHYPPGDRDGCRGEIARQLHVELEQVYQQNQAEVFDLSAQAMGQRSLKNLCLSYLVSLLRPEYLELATHQFRSANN